MALPSSLAPMIYECIHRSRTIVRYRACKISDVAVCITVVFYRFPVNFILASFSFYFVQFDTRQGDNGRLIISRAKNSRDRANRGWQLRNDHDHAGYSDIGRSHNRVDGSLSVRMYLCSYALNLLPRVQ